MALSRKKKSLLVLVILLALLALPAAYYYIELTTEVPIEFHQEPNAVEAHEANRKLKLFTAATEKRRPGYVRFSEVEINSLIESRYTNKVDGASALNVLKSGILLGANNLTFVTWVERKYMGQTIPFIWRRTGTPVREEAGWTFVLQEMRVGNVQIPKRFWPRVNAWLGEADAIFQERIQWLKNLPAVELSRTGQSQPEMRLYNYLPGKKDAKEEGIEHVKSAVKEGESATNANTKPAIAAKEVKENQ